MFAIPGLVALLGFIYLRPQEIVPALQSIPFLYLFVLVALLGWVLDVRLGFTRLRLNTLLIWGSLFFAWSMLTLLIGNPAMFVRQGLLTFTSFFLFASICQAVSTYRSLQTLATTLLVLSLALAGVGLHQASAPQGCVQQDDVELNVWHPDGRSCTIRTDCTDISGGSRYRCERIGLFGTTSVEDRVRYRGIMEDPNELAMVLCVALPFAFIPFRARRNLFRFLLAAGALLAVGLCTIYTHSRSGQMAFLAVMAVHLVRRLGWGGIVVAMVLGAPVLLLGGRADAGADQSTLERLECWSVAIQLFRDSPIVGVGLGQFTEHHYLTAHNSFLLTLAESGFPGMFLYSTVIYLAFKTTLSLRALPTPNGITPARLWSEALFASLSAWVASAFFLSLAEHNVTWTFLALVGALAAAAKRHNPDWKLKFTWRDAILVATVDSVLIAVIFVYTRMRGV
jgi:hypothetical protein